MREWLDKHFVGIRIAGFLTMCALILALVVTGIVFGISWLTNSDDAPVETTVSDEKDKAPQDVMLTVTFDANGGSEVSEELTVKKGAAYGSLPTSERKGYTFGGWYAGDEEVTADSTVTADDTHVLTAKWIANRYKLTLHLYDDVTQEIEVTYADSYGELPTPERYGYTFGGWFVGDNEIEKTSVVTTAEDHALNAKWTANRYTVTLDYGDEETTEQLEVIFGELYGTLPVPEKTGYIFAGWYLDGIRITEETKVATAEDHTLALWWGSEECTVSLNANGGKVDYTPFTVKYDFAYGTLPTPTRTGYTFDGWYLEGKKVTKDSIVYLPIDHTLTAQWKANTYKVTLNANGGTCATTTMTVTCDGTYGKLPIPTRTGYTFGGWYVSEAQILDSTKVTTAKAHTLTAKWYANDYVVKLDGKGGEVLPATVTVFYDGTYGTLPTPVRTGYTFNGWYLDGTKITSTTKVKTASGHTLTAQWTANSYKVTLDPNGGKSSAATVSVKYDSTYSTLPTPTREGYTFLGWYMGDKKLEQNTKVTTAQDHTAVARWQVNDYVVSFETVTGERLPETVTVTYGNAYGALPVPVRAGYTFAGWTYNGAEVTAATVMKTAKNHTLVAKWTANQYLVTLDSNSASATSTMIKVKFGSAYGSLPLLAKTGYHFDGWYYGDELIADESVVSIPADHMLTAKWSPLASVVTLDANGGTVTPGKITVYYDGTYEELPIPTKTGHIFSGWYNGDQLIGAATVVTLTKDHTLKAAWTVAEYEIKLDANGGVVNPASIGVDYGTPYGTLPVPAREGYTFEGWYLGNTLVTAETMVTTDSNHTLKAKWKVNTYKVPLDPNGGTVSPTDEDVTYDEKYGTLPKPTRTGYTFEGWYLGDTLITENTIVKTAKDHTLLAKWKANTYQVTLKLPSGATVNPTTITVTYGQPYGVLPAPTKTGYTLDFWYLNGTQVTSETVVTTASDHTLEVKSEKANVYNVTFNPNGGTVSPTNKNVTYDAKYGTLPIPTRTGYTFDGWYLGGTKVTENTIVKTADDHTLEAKWTAKGEHVTYDPNGGTVSPNGKDVIYDDVYGTLPTPTRTGHIFNGWYLGGTKVTENTIVKTADDHTLEAKWTANTYRVTYNANGGTVSPLSEHKTYDSKYGTLPTPTRTGYAFIGWYLNNSKVTADTVVKTASAHTLTAKWLKTEAKAEYSGRSIKLGEGDTHTDWINTGMSKTELLENGYKTIKIVVVFDGKREDLIAVNKAQLAIVANDTPLVGVDFALILLSRSWTEDITETYTINVANLNDDGSFSVKWSHLSGSGNGEHWFLGTTTVTVTASK